MNDLDEERLLLEVLSIIKEEYIKACQPYIDHLAAIHGRKNTPVIISAEQWFGANVSQDKSAD